MELTYENLVSDEPLSIEGIQREAMIAMRAAGLEPTQIAEILGVTPERVQVQTQSEKAKFRIAQIKESLFPTDPKKRALISSGKAWQVVDNLMETGKETTKLAAALSTLDRAHGKATQPVEVGGSVVRSLLELLDKREKMRELAKEQGQVFDVTPERKQIGTGSGTVTESNPIDQWVEKNFD